MSFTRENLTIIGNSIKSGIVPSLFAYFNEYNDTVTASNYFSDRRLVLGDQIIVISQNKTALAYYYVSAVSTLAGTATVTASVGADLSDYAKIDDSGQNLVANSLELSEGIIETGTAGSTVVVGEVCFLASDGKWDKVDGILDGTDTGFKSRLGMCILGGAVDEPCKMLLQGEITYASFPDLTIGAPVYLSDSAGTVIVTQPSTLNFAIRVIGFGTAQKTMYFNPSNDYIVHA